MTVVYWASLHAAEALESSEQCVQAAGERPPARGDLVAPLGYSVWSAVCHQTTVVVTLATAIATTRL